MAKQNSTNTSITVKSDGFEIAGGTTPRTLTLSGSNLTFVGTGDATIVFPPTSGQLATTGSTPLSGLTDVSLSTIVNNDILYYDNGFWKNTPNRTSSLSTSISNEIVSRESYDSSLSTAIIIGNSTTLSSAKVYTDALAQGISPHAPVKVISTGQTTLSGVQTIDGILLVNSDSILVAGQTNKTENGIYLVNSGGSWSRRIDADGQPDNEVELGDFVFVETGITNSASGWVIGASNTTGDTIIPGINTQEWFKMAAPGTYTTDGLGIELNGSVFTISSEISARISADATVETTVNQSNHNLSVGNIIRISGTTANTFIKAQANSAANAEVIGYVSVVIDINNFKYISHGYVTTGVPAVAVGTVLFLSPTSAGDLTSIEPTSTGHISKPLLTVLESGLKAQFQLFRGMEITAESTYVSKVGVPADNQIGIWTGDGTMKGVSGLTWNGDKLGIGTTNPFTTLVSQTSSLYNIGFGERPNAVSRRWWLTNDYTTFGDFAILTESSKALPNPDICRLLISPTGSVGIGTITPAVKTEIKLNGINGAPATGGTTQTYGILRLGNDQTSKCLDFGQNGSYGSWIQATNNADLTDNYPIRLNPNGGKVIIGMPYVTARANLHTYSNVASDTQTLGTASGSLAISNNNDTYGLNMGVLSTGNAWIQAHRFDGAATAYHLVLQGAGGNVGIGVTPSYKLDVLGDIYTSNAFKANGANAIYAPNQTSNSVGTYVVRNANGWYYDLSSSVRFKDVISSNWTPGDEVLNQFIKLNPILFKYKNAEEITSGYLAEDLSVFPTMVNYDIEGLPYSIREHSLFVYYHLLIQKLIEKIDVLESKI